MKEIFIDILSIQFSKIKELRPTEIKAVAQGYTPSCWQSSDFSSQFSLEILKNTWWLKNRVLGINEHGNHLWLGAPISGNVSWENISRGKNSSKCKDL